MLPERDRPAVIPKAQMSKCDACPFAGMCTPCKPVAINSEGPSLGSSSPITETIKKLAASNVFGKNHNIIFRPTGIEVIRPVSSEKTCSRCGKSHSFYHCEENSKAA